MANLHTPTQFRSRSARLGVAVVGLFLAYLLGSRAIDTGSWWQYSGTALLLILSLRLLKRANSKK